MKNTDYKEHYQRNLPHYQPAGATLFLTARLAGTLPKRVLDKLEAEQALREGEILRVLDPVQRERLLVESRKRHFGHVDAALDQTAFGPAWLANPAIAQRVYDSIRYRDGRSYELDAFTLMPNHMHLVFRPLMGEDGRYQSLSSIMVSLKRYTARSANELLQREGTFWQHENYDHVVRDEQEWQRIIRYVLENPVKAGLVDEWEAWPWTYLREE